MGESHFWLRCNSFVSLPRSRVCFTARKLVVEGERQKRRRSTGRKRKSREKGRSHGAFKDQFPLRRCSASSNSLFNLQSCLPFVLEVHPLLRRRTGSLFPLPFCLARCLRLGLSIRFAPMAWLNGADRNSGGVAEARIQRNSPLGKGQSVASISSLLWSAAESPWPSEDLLVQMCEDWEIWGWDFVRMWYKDAAVIWK